ncbi:MAG: hypothetical protein U5K74_03040 [Gemmatimonadaceae bacterium]|nr:hypothetical protein [Gemmatimonadaceae bacterium]
MVAAAVAGGVEHELAAADTGGLLVVGRRGEVEVQLIQQFFRGRQGRSPVGRKSGRAGNSFARIVTTRQRHTAFERPMSRPSGLGE